MSPGSSSRGALAELARGAGAFFGGVSFVVRTPGVWGWVLVPAAIVLGLGVVLGGLGVWGVVRVSDVLLRGRGDTLFTGLARMTFDVVAGGAAVFVAVLVALAVAQPLARFALDRITARLEGSASRRAPSSGLLASLGSALTVLGVTIPAVGVLEAATLLAPEAALVTEPIAFAISALALAWELFDYPLSRRGLGGRERLRWMRGHFFAVLGFALAAQLLLLIPGLDLLLLPMGIAGATRLLAEREPEPAALPPRSPQAH